MNKSKTRAKIVASIVLAATLIMLLSVTAFAEETGTKDYLSDPMFFRFIFLVVAFFSAIISAALIYFAVKNGKKEKYYEEREGTVKLYEDLDDAKWDAPDSVFIDAMEPTAAILNELEPVKPIRGLDGFVITEEPIDPVQAINMGADPYAYNMGNEVTNTVFESPETTPITAGDLDSAEKKQPAPTIERAPAYFSQPQYSPFVEPQKQPTEHPYVYQNVRYTVLEDGHIAAEPVKPIDYPETPKNSPFTYITPASTNQDVPITIYTSADDDGVVQINATVFENTVVASTLKDDAPVVTIGRAEPIVAASTPSGDPFARSAAREEEPIYVPDTQAAIFQSPEPAAVLEDDVSEISIPTEPVKAATPPSPSMPLAYMTVAPEEPVEIPVTEANIFEDNIIITALEDEIIPTVEEPVVIPEIATPMAAPLTATYVAPEEPVEIPVTEANVFEDNVVVTALEDEGKVAIAKCDVGDDGDEIAAQYRVRNVPTILFFKDGQQVDKHVGTATKEQLKAKIDALL